jgi:hypothetical protein
MYRWDFFALVGCEVIYFVDIVIHFFLQDLDVDRVSRRDDLSTVANRYYEGSFK